MKQEDVEYKDLFEELSEYEKSGVRMKLGKRQASPMQIVSAFLAKEEGMYMRDYILNEEGVVEELNFNELNKF